MSQSIIIPIIRRYAGGPGEYVHINELHITPDIARQIYLRGKCEVERIRLEAEKAPAPVAADKPAPSLSAWASGHCPTCHQHKDVMGMPCSDPWHVEQVCAIGAKLAEADSAATEWLTQQNQLTERVAELEQMAEINRQSSLGMRAERDKALADLAASREETKVERGVNFGLKTDLAAMTERADAEMKHANEWARKAHDARAEAAALRRDLCQIAEGCGVGVPDAAEAKRRIIAIAKERDALRECDMAHKLEELRQEKDALKARKVTP